jgi:RND family efflux transporter MFP subunit
LLECADKLVNLRTKSKKTGRLATPPQKGRRAESAKLAGEQESILDVSVLSATLFAEQETAPRARILARFIGELLAECAVSVYTLSTDGQDEFWNPRATFGEAAIHKQAIPAASGMIGELLQESTAVTRDATQIKREDYPHVDTRKSLVSLSYIPLIHKDSLVGAVEILAFEEEVTEETLEALQPAAQVGAAALAAAQAYEEERHGTMGSISRLTQLYDLEKVFSSTLEMNELLPLIGSKYSEVLECEAVNIWLLQGDESVELMHQAGEDATAFRGQILKPNEGIAGTISDNGESLLLFDPEDERLKKRNEGHEEGVVVSLIAGPIMDNESLVGVVEAVNKLYGTPFDDDDLFMLSNLNGTASTALHNASLLLAERKVEILETLNTVSHEITSTLNLERMLQTIVNAPQAVIPYERAAIVLEQRGRFKLSALTGQTQVNADAPDVAPLNEILQWASLSEEVIHVRQHGDVVDSEREETRAKFKKYFEETGMRGFYAMPLNDDTGRVGMLAMESSDPDFLSSAHLEILQVLASQATVALRNAQMYKEVPFISVIEPVLVRKRQFMAMEKRRRTLTIALAVAALLFLVVFPLPLRVDGDAVVAPVRRAEVQPEEEGVVSKVFVHEGQKVQAGQVLAEMELWNAKSKLAETQSKYESAMLQMNHALASNDGSEAGVQKTQADYWKAELERSRQLLDRTQLRSPIDGIVSTPHIEDFAGRKLAQGEQFAEVVDTSDAVVDIGIDDTDAGLLKAGQKASIKLNSYPTRTFHGAVSIVSPKADLQHETAIFYSRVAVSNSDGAMRAGMEGRGKIRVGWYPAGYVLFRRAFLWVYAKAWYWLGW